MIKSQKMKNYLLLVFVTVFISCSKEKTDPKDDNIIIDIKEDYSEYLIKDYIETDIEFMPKEEYTNYSEVGLPQLKLFIMTTDFYASTSNSIQATEFFRGDEMIIRFEKIIEPTIGYMTIDRAYYMTSLPENIDKLTLINGDSIDTYSVTINNKFVQLIPYEVHFTNSLYAKTFRYPENSFAFICGTYTDNTFIHDEFLNLLKLNKAFEEFNFDGDGRIPYATSIGHYVNYPTIFFKYTNEKDFDSLEQVLKRYSEENIPDNCGAVISLVSWNNKKFLSWLLN
jgi:hypothetical protein